MEKHTIYSESKKSLCNILLTGGTGFFGRSLLRNWIEQARYCEKVPQVCILTRCPQTFLVNFPEFSGHDWLKYHKGNILNPASLPINVDFTHILHAATDSTLGPKLTPLQRYSQIVDGTRNMLDYAVSNQISRFLLTSSGGVYGAQPQGMEEIHESYNGIPDPLIADNAYSIAKRCAEHLCGLYFEQFGLQAVIARCFSFVGRDLPKNVHFAIGNFIHDAINSSEITVLGDGSPIRSYLDQRDLAEWLSGLLFHGIGGEAYNVGSDQAITIGDLAFKIRDIIAPHKSVRIKKQNNNNFRNRYIPCIKKIKENHDVQIKFTLNESILEVVKNLNTSTVIVNK